ncbi:MAG: hypothetical protein HDR02_07920 [Lachnospiraceae bacterium]|nr:hypothetical protein [Lachnospiraceae bacterium]
MKRWRIRGICAVFLLLSMVVAGCAVAPVYYLNDDVTMRGILAGACTGAPDGHAVYMRYPLTILLAALYRLTDWLHLSVPWFDLFLGGCILLVSAGVLVNCWELSRERYSRVCLALTGILIFVGLLLPHYLYMHYTVVAAILAGGAMFLWVTGNGRVLPVTLLVLCYLVRSQVFFLALPFLLVAVLAGLTERHSLREPGTPLWVRIKKIVLPSLLPLLTLGIVVSVLWGVDCVGYGSPQWRAYREYNNSRTRLYDYTDFLSTDRYRETYEQLGLDRQQYQVLAHYDLLLDGDVDGELLERTAQRIEDMGVDTSDSRYLWQCLKNYYLHVRYDGWPYSLIWAGAWGLLLIILAVDRRWRKLTLLAALLLGRSLIWVYLIARGRFPERVWLSLYLMEICLLLGLLLRECVGLREAAAGGRKHWIAMGCLALCLALVGSVVPTQLRRTVQRVTQQQEKQDQWNLLTDSLDGQYLYLMDVYSAVAYAGELYRKDCGHIMLLGGWLTQSPLVRQRLAAYDAGDGAQALRHEQVRLIVDGSRDVAWLEEYLQQKLGAVELQAEESIVCGKNLEFVIYRLEERE